MLSISYVTLLAGESLLSILFFHYSLTKKINRFKILILLLTILKFIFEINFKIVSKSISILNRFILLTIILCVLFRYVLSEETLLDCKNLCKCEFESRDTIVTCKGEHINEIPQNTYTFTNYFKIYFRNKQACQYVISLS
jgi:hypothetical protein